MRSLFSILTILFLLSGIFNKAYTQESITQLEQLYKSSKNAQDKLKYALSILKIRHTSGLQDSSYSKALYNTGAAYQKNKQYALALKYLKQAVSATNNTTQ